MTLSNTKYYYNLDLFPKNNMFWFAAYTKPKQEKFIRNRLNEMGIENFIPTKIEERQWKYRKQKVEVPLIPRLVFIRTSFEKAFSLINDYNFQIKYIKDSDTKTLLVIPEKQMKDFILVVESNLNDTELITSNFVQGEMVEIIKGPFKGVQGELVNFKDRKRVVVSITGIAAILLDIPISCLKKTKI